MHEKHKFIQRLNSNLQVESEFSDIGLLLFGRCLCYIFKDELTPKGKSEKNILEQEKRIRSVSSTGTRIPSCRSLRRGPG